MTTVTDLLEPVEADLEILLSDLRSLIGAGHPILRPVFLRLTSGTSPHIILILARLH